MPKFQSLLHQGISLLEMQSVTDVVAARVFQSLLHQGISLLGAGIRGPRPRRVRVSIPSSSGHQFTGIGATPTRQGQELVSIPSSSGHQFTVDQIQASFGDIHVEFQSLLHQGISLLNGKHSMLFQLR